MSRRPCAALLLISALALSRAGSASADDGDGDGLYGRFDGDVWLTAAVGAGGVIGTGATRNVGTFELRARFLDSVGPFAFAQGDGLFTTNTLWSVGAGLELRPLFLARFLTNNSFGHEWLDVFVDSVGLDLGVVALSLDRRTRAALVFGGGLEVPILLGDPRLSLRFGVRWTHADHLDSGVQNEVTFAAALVLSAPVQTGLGSREGPRALRE